jgi:hypothetical protein
MIQLKLDVIKEAVELMETFGTDKEVIKEQCNIILRVAREIKNWNAT